MNIERNFREKRDECRERSLYLGYIVWFPHNNVLLNVAPPVCTTYIYD